MSPSAEHPGPGLYAESSFCQGEAAPPCSSGPLNLAQARRLALTRSSFPDLQSLSNVPRTGAGVSYLEGMRAASDVETRLLLHVPGRPLAAEAVHRRSRPSSVSADRLADRPRIPQGGGVPPDRRCCARASRMEGFVGSLPERWSRRRRCHPGLLPPVPGPVLVPGAG